MRIVLPAKKQSDILTPFFDFTSFVQPTDALSSPTITVSVWSGVDPSPQSVYGNICTINGFVVSPKLQGGIVGVIYLVKVQVSDGTNSYSISALLAVIPDGP